MLCLIGSCCGEVAPGTEWNRCLFLIRVTMSPLYLAELYFSFSHTADFILHRNPSTYHTRPAARKLVPLGVTQPLGSEWPLVNSWLKRWGSSCSVNTLKAAAHVCQSLTGHTHVNAASSCSLCVSTFGGRCLRCLGTLKWMEMKDGDALENVLSRAGVLDVSCHLRTLRGFVWWRQSKYYNNQFIINQTIKIESSVRHNCIVKHETSSKPLHKRCPVEKTAYCAVYQTIYDI